MSEHREVQLMLFAEEPIEPVPPTLCDVLEHAATVEPLVQDPDPIAIALPVLRALSRIAEVSDLPPCDRILQVEEGEHGVVLVTRDTAMLIAVRISEMTRTTRTTLLAADAIRSLPAKGRVTLSIQDGHVMLRAREGEPDPLVLLFQASATRPMHWRSLLAADITPTGMRDFDPRKAAAIESCARRCGAHGLRFRDVASQIGTGAIRIYLSDDRAIVAALAARSHEPRDQAGALPGWTQAA